MWSYRHGPADATGSASFSEERFGLFGVADVVGGVVTLRIPSGTLGVGTYNMVATYGGDEHFSAETSRTIAFTVGDNSPRTYTNDTDKASPAHGTAQSAITVADRSGTTTRVTISTAIQHPQAALDNRV